MRKFLVITLLFEAASVHATSIDCRKTTSQIERQICDDTFLRKLDSVLADNYSFMLASDFGHTKESLKAAQRTWIAKRNACMNRSCLVDAYRVRIDETCGYGVVTGVHPVCSFFDEVILENVK